MSSPKSSGHSPDAGASDDRIDFGKVITVGVVSLIIFALSSYWAYVILRGERKELDKKGLANEPTEIGKPEIGIVDQVPFDGDKRLEAWKKERHDALHSYGWSDRKHGLIHIPIEKAMSEIVAGAAPAALPGSTPAPAPAAAPSAHPTGGGAK